MVYQKQLYLHSLLLGVVLGLGLTACTQQAPRTKRGQVANNSEGQESTYTGALIELTQAKDPLTGNLGDKVSIPRNYSGDLELTGFNLKSLHDGNLFAKVTFGHTRIEVPLIEATVKVMPGLTADTKIDTLVLHLAKAPFKDIPLDYQLFDYSQYDFDMSSVGVDIPVASARDENLFCRGLQLSDDPTFNKAPSLGCKEKNDVCKYAYANIYDQAANGEAAIEPDLSSSEGSPAFGTNLCQSELAQGPSAYAPLDSNDWSISGEALFGKFGVFLEKDSMNSGVGKKAFLFPRYGKLDLKSGVQYQGSNSSPSDLKTQKTMTQDGQSSWVDGCNLRALARRDNKTHQGSCNISARIELFKMDQEGTLHPVSVIQGGDRNIKIQLLPDEIFGSNGNSQNYQCKDSSTCGKDSCCYNGRCWSKSFVSFCKEDLDNSLPSQLGEGESCERDLQCRSYCCSGQRCGTHQDEASDDDSGGQSNLCQKRVGESCLSRAWCDYNRFYSCSFQVAAANQPEDPQADLDGAYTCSISCKIEVQRWHHDCINRKCVDKKSELLGFYNKLGRLGNPSLLSFPAPGPSVPSTLTVPLKSSTGEFYYQFCSEQAAQIPASGLNFFIPAP